MAFTKIIILTIQESPKIEVLTHALSASLQIARSLGKIRLLLFMSRRHFDCITRLSPGSFETEINFFIEMLGKNSFNLRSQLAFIDLFCK